jgi:hypothetical protein
VNFSPNAWRSKKKIAFMIHGTKNVRLANLHTRGKPRLFEMRSWRGTDAFYLLIDYF